MKRLLSHFHRKLRRSFGEEAITRPALGQHVIADFLNCRTLSDDAETIQQHMEEAARRVGATIVQSVFHNFCPYGVSGVVVVSESHLAIHTWPEHGAACVDLFTCSRELHPRIGFDYLCGIFGAESYDLLEIPRGTAVFPSVTIEPRALAMAAE